MRIINIWPTKMIVSFGMVACTVNDISLSQAMRGDVVVILHTAPFNTIPYVNDRVGGDCFCPDRLVRLFKQARCSDG
jgi:hypothetical protein